MINTLRMDHKVITSHQFSCDFYFKPWQKMVVSADPVRPCTKGLCRKAWQSSPCWWGAPKVPPAPKLTSNNSSLCHQYRSKHFREHSIHGTQPQNKLNRYKPFFPLWKTEKGCSPLDILPQQKECEKSEKQGNTSCMESVSVQWTGPDLPKICFTVTKCKRELNISNIP